MTNEEKKKDAYKKEKPYVPCECGMRVHGTTFSQATAMLENHKRSKAHKNLMEQKK